MDRPIKPRMDNKSWFNPNAYSYILLPRMNVSTRFHLSIISGVSLWRGQVRTLCTFTNFLCGGALGREGMQSQSTVKLLTRRRCVCAVFLHRAPSNLVIRCRRVQPRYRLMPTKRCRGFSMQAVHAHVSCGTRFLYDRNLFQSEHKRLVEPPLLWARSWGEDPSCANTPSFLRLLDNQYSRISACAHRAALHVAEVKPTKRNCRVCARIRNRQRP